MQVVYGKKRSRLDYKNSSENLPKPDIILCNRIRAGDLFCQGCPDRITPFAFLRNSEDTNLAAAVNLAANLSVELSPPIREFPAMISAGSR
jgi:hypothetical protein